MCWKANDHRKHTKWYFSAPANGQPRWREHWTWAGMWMLWWASVGGLDQSLNFAGSQFPQGSGRAGLIMSTFDLSLEKGVLRTHRTSTKMRLVKKQNYMFYKDVLICHLILSQSWFLGFVGTYIWWGGFYKVKRVRWKMTIKCNLCWK